MIQSLAIDNTFRVYVETSIFTAADAVVATVDRIWAAAQKQNSNLYDGMTLCVSRLEPTEMWCKEVPYRFLYGQLQDPSVAKALNLSSACVSGITELSEGVIWGVRSSVSSLSGLNELAPSGSLPTSSSHEGEVNFIEHLLSELTEETGVSKHNVTSVSPFLLVLDRNEHVIDLCCRIGLSELTTAEILRAFPAGEYSELHIEPLKSLKALTRHERENWVPTSLAILDAIRT